MALAAHRPPMLAQTGYDEGVTSKGVTEQRKTTNQSDSCKVANAGMTERLLLRRSPAASSSQTRGKCRRTCWPGVRECESALPATALGATGARRLSRA